MFPRKLVLICQTMPAWCQVSQDSDLKACVELELGSELDSQDLQTTATAKWSAYPTLGCDHTDLARNVAVKSVALLFLVLQVPGSNFGLETGYRQEGLS
jgi:hypothetical protein